MTQITEDIASWREKRTSHVGYTPLQNTNHWHPLYVKMLWLDWRCDVMPVISSTSQDPQESQESEHTVGYTPHQPIRVQSATETGTSHHTSGSVIGLKTERVSPIQRSDLWLVLRGGRDRPLHVGSLDSSSTHRRSYISAPVWGRNTLHQTVRFTAQQGVFAPVGCWSLTWRPGRKRATRMIVTPASKPPLSPSLQLRSTLARSQSSGSQWQ